MWKLYGLAVLAVLALNETAEATPIFSGGEVRATTRIVSATGFCCLDQDSSIISADGTTSSGAFAGEAEVTNLVRISLGTSASFMYTASWDAGSPDSLGRFASLQSSGGNAGDLATLTVDAPTEFLLWVNGGVPGMSGSANIFRSGGGLVAGVSVTGEQSTHVTLTPGQYDILFNGGGGNLTGVQNGSGTVIAVIQAVPEPSTAALLAGGLMLLAARMRRRQDRPGPGPRAQMKRTR